MYESIFKDTMVEMSWEEIEKAGEKNIPVLFPLGVIEEHGPHLPLGSDIYWSYAMCRMVKEKLAVSNQESLIAPPYYWGINHCTGGFPGTFSLKPETMKQVLFETFENLKQFNLTTIYCFNYHGDGAHVNAIIEAIKAARLELELNVKFVLNAMDLRLYGWSGNEEFLLVVDPNYPMELFDEEEPSERGLLDIHAGAFETATMEYLCPDLVNIEVAKQLSSTSLNKEGMKAWMQGGEIMKNSLPLGYAGNPAGYAPVRKHVEAILNLQVEDIVKQMIDL